MPRDTKDDIQQDKATLVRIAVSRERNKLRCLGEHSPANWLSYYLTDADEKSMTRLFEFLEEAKIAGGLTEKWRG